jgi:hypothetical protein
VLCAAPLSRLPAYRPAGGGEGHAAARPGPAIGDESGRKQLPHVRKSSAVYIAGHAPLVARERADHGAAKSFVLLDRGPPGMRRQTQREP